MIDVNSIPVYEMKNTEKDDFMLNHMNSLTQYHLHNCVEYKTLLQKFGSISSSYSSMFDIPFLPVRLFKSFDLMSVSKEEIVKTMTSSGTTGQKVSKVFLDKETSALQIKVLSKIMANFIGKTRVPMLIIDTKKIIDNREIFSARTAGVLGFSIFGKDVQFALDDDMNINYKQVENFIKKYQGENILVFGFTFIIWKHFIQELEKSERSLDLSKATLFHGGGWKQIESESVDNVEFQKRIIDSTRISKVHNYYGMVEQTGSIYVECEMGFFHAPSFSDVIIRNHKTHKPEKNGSKGLIQLLSIIPKSYPGHSILTEDLGTIYGVDNCQCGRKGKFFKVHGRIKSAEIRGCSDTYT